MHAAARAAAGIGFVIGLTNVSPGVLAKIPDAPLCVPDLGGCPRAGQVSALDAARRKAPILVSTRSILYDAREKLCRKGPGPQ
ncbi:MAG: hypothetical protein U1F77_19940 [Kiritimatiellia bacterium]